MDRKHNKKITPAAKILRKTLTKEERHLWYDFLKDYSIRFIGKKYWVLISQIFIVQKQS